MLAQTPQTLSASASEAIGPLKRCRAPEFASNDKLAGRKATENLERLEADQDLVYHLALAGWEGPLWQQFQRALAEYGYPIVRAWVRSGQIFTECANKGIPVKRRHLKIRADDAKELANDVVGYGIAEFRTGVLIPALWDPTKKATLSTFFVGQCILQFPNAYRRWVTEQCEPPPGTHALAGHPLNALPADIENTAELSRFLATVDSNDPRLIRGAMELGHAQHEIASMLGITTRAVESRLYRLNREGEIWP